MPSYKYRHWDGKAYQFMERVYTSAQKKARVEAARQRYKLVRVVIADVYRGKPDSWDIYVHIPSRK